MYGRGLKALDVPRSRTVCLFANACVHDTPGLALPRAEVHLAVRFGAAAERGLDLHALGPRQRTYRKELRGGMQTLLARLPLGSHEAVFGVPCAELSERTVPLEMLWGEAAHVLAAQLADAHDLSEAAARLERALATRLRTASFDARTRLVREAARHLGDGRVHQVAEALGVSERNLRRVFREVVGMGPKEFAKLTRFQRAPDEARRASQVDWARIAAATGYYDQAHLIAEFRDLSGVTPRTLLQEF